MTFKPLTVVSIAEFNQRSDALVREVHETGEPLFVMDGEKMVVRILPPDATLAEIEQNLAFLEEIDKTARAIAPHLKGDMTAVEMVDDQRKR